MILDGEHKGTGQENVYNRRYYVTLASMHTVERSLNSGVIELDGSNQAKYKVTFKLKGDYLPENRTRVDIGLGEESFPVSAKIVSHRLQYQAGRKQPSVYYRY